MNRPVIFINIYQFVLVYAHRVSVSLRTVWSRRLSSEGSAQPETVGRYCLSIVARFGCKG